VPVLRFGSSRAGEVREDTRREKNKATNGGGDRYKRRGGGRNQKYTDYNQKCFPWWKSSEEKRETNRFLPRRRKKKKKKISVSEAAKVSGDLWCFYRSKVAFAHVIEEETRGNVPSPIEKKSRR